ncbi:ZMYM6 protein, partial [Atractosteus spatula]|nr:ZMYM6 protein [Atractosteus spatula]
VMLCYVKAGKPHTIFEEPYLLLAKELTRIMCGEKAAKQLDLLPPPKDTATHKIIDMAADIKSTLIERVKMSRCFSLQTLFCKLLPTGTTGEYIFQLLNEFIEENGIDWIKCVGVCTDGARAMTSRHRCSCTNWRGCSRNEWTHCNIHRETFAVKKMSDSVRLCCELYQGSKNEFTSALLG